MTSAHTAQSFVRALKASSDPPQPGGPCKIEIAREAWDNTSFYVPSKGELIADWVLTKLLKDRLKEASINPLLDLPLWTLLADVLVSPSAVDVRSVQTWLKALLNHIPIAPIVISLFSLLATLESESCQQLTFVAWRSLALIWPLGAHKLSSDTLLECFGAFLGVSKHCETDENLTRIGLVITSSFRISQGNSSNKKKLYFAFLQGHLQSWMESTLARPNSSLIYATLLEDVYAAGIETIFSLENLRQSHEQTFENTLFASLGNIIPTSTALVLAVLPRIFASFVQCVKKSRTALFNQASNQPSSASVEGVRATGMAFFASCQTLLDTVASVKTWSTRVALLSLVYEEQLFSPTQLDFTRILKQNAEIAITALSTGGQGQVEIIKFAAECLSALTRIDYDLIANAIPRILPQLLFISTCDHSLVQFLDLLLDHHSKTRTIHTYIAGLFAALSPCHLSTSPENSRSDYQVSSSGPLFHPTHFDRLAKCTHGFLTSSQTVDTVRSVFQYLTHTWQQFHSTGVEPSATNGEGSRKKRKLEAALGQSINREALAITFSHSARIASVVLSSLPLQLVPDPMRQDIRMLLSENYRSLIQLILARAFKIIQKRDLDDVWGYQILATSTLRLQYALTTSRNLALPAFYDPKLSAKMISIIGDDEILPELSLEIYRTLFAFSSEGYLTNHQVVLVRSLDYLDTNFAINDVNWSGSSYHLMFGGQGKKECALALLHMLILRWLPVVDALASGPQLEILVRLLTSIRVGECLTSPPTTELRGNELLAQALRSAHFWELPNLRNALITFINKETSTLDCVDITKGFCVAKPKPEHSAVCRTIAVYEMLLLFPMEYLPRVSRTDLVKRAQIADFLINTLHAKDASLSYYTCHCVTVLRVFLKRVFVYLGPVDHPIKDVCEFLEHIMNSEQVPQPTAEYTTATSDLVEHYLLAVLKSTEKPDAILRTLNFLAESKLFQSAYVADGPRLLILQQTFMQLIDLLTREFLPSDFMDDVQAFMHSLHEKFLSCLLPHVSTVATNKVSVEVTTRSHLLWAWHGVLSFGRWLRLRYDAIPRFGKGLISKIISSSPKAETCDDICVVGMAILLEELQFYPDPDHLSHSHLDIAVAAYIVISQFVSSNGRTRIDAHMSKAYKLLPISHFSHILVLVGESMSNVDRPPEDLTCLVHLSVVLLQDPPQGSLKCIQTFTSACVNTFVGGQIFTLGPPRLRLQVLDFVSRHCSDRPAALRLVDIGNIWSLLSMLLRGSVTHDESTSADIFHGIITITSALIRLRRDLVTLTLPHLGMVLGQLMMSTRSLRPHLGGKQRSLVADTLPRWINLDQPLGAKEVKSLARLLETLTTKSIVRIHTSTETQRAESLAKPFSKHAAYVLKAYVDAMNDPLCVLPFEIRKELRPGLFALCGVLNDHSRDAMMVSVLDSGGKTTMKMLWKEYEKQRYIGKG